jgi:hypothetical protein
LCNVLPEIDGKYQTLLEMYKKGVIAIRDTRLTWLQPRSGQNSRTLNKKQRLLHWHKLSTVVDYSAFTISGDSAEHAFYPHTNLRVFRTADNLCCHAWPFIEFHYGKHIGGECLKLFIRCMDDGICHNRAKSSKLAIDNPATTATVRTEGPRGEKMAVTGFALCPNHVIPLGYLSPESCDRHIRLSQECEQQPLLRYLPHYGSYRSSHYRSGAYPPRFGVAGQFRIPV